MKIILTIWLLIQPSLILALPWGLQGRVSLAEEYEQAGDDEYFEFYSHVKKDFKLTKNLLPFFKISAVKRQNEKKVTDETYRLEIGFDF